MGNEFTIQIFPGVDGHSLEELKEDSFLKDENNKLWVRDRLKKIDESLQKQTVSGNTLYLGDVHRRNFMISFQNETCCFYCVDFGCVKKSNPKKEKQVQSFLE